MTQQRDILINDIIKVTVCELEVEPNCDDVNKERIFEDDVMSLPNENIFQDFAFVVEKQRINSLVDKSDENILLKAMNMVNLKNRELESENVVCKYIMLNRRWFEKTILSVPK